MQKSNYGNINIYCIVLLLTGFIFCVITMREAEISSKQMDNLTISCWNSRGLVAALPYLNKLLESNDIIAISEHWLQENRINVLLEISNDFNVVARSSKHSGAGTCASDYDNWTQFGMFEQKNKHGFFLKLDFR